ncbi:MAG: hypothetical protein KDK12_09930 [Rhodobacteraceae bacterium]|nr:hypothetical protein [Paracoccaceae bacterium]
MRPLQLLSLIGLVLTLVSGSVTMASARHQAQAVGEVVICTGYGLTTITIDENGNPVTGEPILCPDCLPALAALTDTVVSAPPAPAGTLTPVAFASDEIPAPPPPAPAHNLTRGPPVPA